MRSRSWAEVGSSHYQELIPLRNSNEHQLYGIRDWKNRMGWSDLTDSGLAAPWTPVHGPFTSFAETSVPVNVRESPSAVLVALMVGKAGVKGVFAGTSTALL